VLVKTSLLYRYIELIKKSVPVADQLPGKQQEWPLQGVGEGIKRSAYINGYRYPMDLYAMTIQAIIIICGFIPLNLQDTRCG
jgi:hypothetical protein